jgi:dihydroorotate dehydrogenase (NAD+) catalytic subunit
VSVIEIGLPPLASREQALRLIQAASGELPVVACLSLTRAQESWLGELAQAGASGLTLAAPRGQLPKADGGWQSGRLLGAALFPLVLNAVRETRGLGLPVIAGCGVASPAHGEALLAAGAWAVEVDTALWL